MYHVYLLKGGKREARCTNSLTLFARMIERARENRHLLSWTGPAGTNERLMRLGTVKQSFVITPEYEHV